MSTGPMRYRNIVFDFDGTITDSKRDIAGAQLWVLRRMGVEGHREEDLYPLIGTSLQDTFAALLPPAMHHRIDEAAELYARYYPPRSLETTTLFPGVHETLAALHASGRRLAVASTKRGTGIRRATDHFGITGLFVQLQGSDNLPFKPDPAILLKLLRDQRWDPGETLMVGDTDKDVLTGRRAGVPTCAVTYGSLTRAELAAFEPDHLIDRLNDLLTIV
jgi:HAD superfamily hydrolase (TIGR01549 family)